MGSELSSTGSTGVLTEGEISSVATGPHDGPPEGPHAAPAVPVLADGENEWRAVLDAVVGENVESEEECGDDDGQ